MTSPPGRMSLTRRVAVAVPSLTHPSVPVKPSFAEKNTWVPTTARLPGIEPPAAASPEPKQAALAGPAGPASACP
jgi:hypothetical protein